MNELDGKIAVLRTKISVEDNPTIKSKYQRQLQKLNIKKQIQALKNRLDDMN